MKKLLTTTLGLTLAGTALAAGTGTTTQSSKSLTDLYNELKESKIGVSLVSDHNLTRNDSISRELNSWRMDNYLYINKKLTDVDSLSLENVWTHKNSKDNANTSTFASNNLRYTRKLLSEATSGINLALRLDRKVYNNAKNARGRNTISLKGSKTLTSNLTGSLYGYYANYDRKNDNDATDKDYFRVIGSQTLDLGNGFYASSSQDYINIRRMGNGPRTEVLNVELAVGKALTDKLDLNFNIDTDILASHDGSTFVNHAEDNISYGMTLSATAF